MTASELAAMYEAGTIHHVTMRGLGMKCHEGLSVYIKDASGFRGYRHAGAIYSDAADFEEAYQLGNAHQGVCVGSFEHGG